MTPALDVLLVSAVSFGVLHTVIGVDHYVPFIALGVALSRLEIIESARGQWAGWLLIGFGIAYGSWGFDKALRSRTHGHLHAHEDGERP